MDDMNVFERQVVDQIHRFVGPARPVDDAAIFSSITAIQSSQWRFQTMFSATKFVAAGAIVALIGGMALVGVVTQPRDDGPPVVGASASAATSAEPTDAATSEPEATTDVAEPTSMDPDLLPGVELVTMEVEPGVYRVVSDGFRDLSTTTFLPIDAGRSTIDAVGSYDYSIFAAPDSGIWLFGPDGIIRLGQAGAIDGQAGGVLDIEASPDGALWVTEGFSPPWQNFSRQPSGIGKVRALRLLQGGVWLDPGFDPVVESFDVNDIAIDKDGALWSVRWSDGCAEDADAEDTDAEDGPCGSYLARLDPGSGEELEGILAPSRAKNHRYLGAVGLRATDDGAVWLLDAWKSKRNSRVSVALNRFDGTGFQRHDLPDGTFNRADMAVDGTMWALLRSWKQPTLARFDGSEWTAFEEADGVPRMDGIYYGRDRDDGGFFEVAPDGSVWFTPSDDRGDADGGVANFDGHTLRRFLPDRYVNAMDVGPDGSVWLQTGRPYRADGEIRLDLDMYVITREALAAAG